MKAPCRRGMVCLAVVWLATAPLLAAAAPLQAAPQGEPTSATFAGWIEGWLARLLPGWTFAAAETEPPADPPPTPVLDLDDPMYDECVPGVDPDCTDPEMYPDAEPDG